MTHVPGISSLMEGKYKIKNLNLSVAWVVDLMMATLQYPDMICFCC